MLMSHRNRHKLTWRFSPIASLCVTKTALKSVAKTAQNIARERALSKFELSSTIVLLTNPRVLSSSSLRFLSEFEPSPTSVLPFLLLK